MNIFVLLIILVVGLPLLAVVGLIIRLLVKSRRTGIWILLAVALLFFMVAILHKNRQRMIFVQSNNRIDSLTKHPVDDVPPIWMPGVEDQFEADVYPSELSAKRAIGVRTKEQEDVNLSTVAIETHPASWSSGSKNKLNSGRIEAVVVSNNKKTTISSNFVEKPWIENFADFVNRNPKDKWILALSQQSCASQAEAERQALNNACVKVAYLLNQMLKHRPAVGLKLTVNPDDIRNGGFVEDRFAQSFDGTAGRIWRQALLIKASQDKLTELARKKMKLWQSRRSTWIREIISVVGITILICVVYLFLNAATRGYYTWSLRIAAIVFVSIVIFLVLTLSYKITLFSNTT